MAVMTSRKPARKSAATNGAAANGAERSGDVKDMKLAREGKARIEWAERHMPVLRAITSVSVRPSLAARRRSSASSEVSSCSVVRFICESIALKFDTRK